MKKKASSPQPFRCRRCSRMVEPDGAGSRHRNHCPHCLHSVHLDQSPGDREAECGGLMEPIALWSRRGGEWALIHRCQSCGRLSSNRVLADDNDFVLLQLAARPLAHAPFPVDRL